MTDIVPVAGWSSIPQIDTNTVALGGPGGPANMQAQALANRTELLNLEKAPKASPIFTGAPEAPLAPLFDFSSKLANTQYVRDHAGNMNEWRQYNSNKTLESSDCGRPLKVFGGGNKTITLPLASACPSGSVIFIATVDAGTTATIQTQGGNGAARWSNGLVLTGNFTETAVFISDGGSAWILAGGTAVNKYKHIAATNGYMVMDNGFILQWGRYSGNVVSGTLTYPIAFPNAVLSGHLTMRDQASGVQPTTVFFLQDGSTLTQALYHLSGAAPGSAVVFHWWALGY